MGSRVRAPPRSPNKIKSLTETSLKLHSLIRPIVWAPCWQIDCRARLKSPSNKVSPMSTNQSANTTESIDLPYEIDHLRAAYRLLPQYGPQDPHLHNLIVEAFWLHARNLVEMFLGRSNATNPNHMASDYTPREIAKLTGYYGLICKQITHLKNGRPVADTDKLNCRDPDFIDLIEEEIAQFIGLVRADVRAHLGPDKVGSPMLPDRVIGPRNSTSTVARGWTGPVNSRNSTLPSPVGPDLSRST